jgi:hypothetical protein
VQFNEEYIDLTRRSEGVWEHNKSGLLGFEPLWPATKTSTGLGSTPVLCSCSYKLELFVWTSFLHRNIVKKSYNTFRQTDMPIAAVGVQHFFSTTSPVSNGNWLELLWSPPMAQTIPTLFTSLHPRWNCRLQQRFHFSIKWSHNNIIKTYKILYLMILFLSQVNFTRCSLWFWSFSFRIPKIFIIGLNS